MKTAALIPDSLKNPSGGMGILGEHLNEGLKWDYVIDSSYYRPTVETMEPNNVMHQALNQASILSVLYDLKPDLIHSFDWSTIWAAYQYQQATGSKFIYHAQLHIRDCFIGYDDFYAEMLFRAIEDAEFTAMKSADHIIQVSNCYAKKYPKIFLPKTTVIYNGIDFEYWQKDFEPIELPGNRPIKLLYIGRYAGMKNVHSLLESNIPKDIDLIFAGGSTSGEKSIYDLMLNKVKLNENIHYIGPIYGEIKRRTLKQVDAIIVPSLVEPFGIVGLEGLASKSLVLSSRKGGLGEYLDDSCSIYCGVTPDEISNSFKILLNSNKENLIKNGLKRAKQFDWKFSIDKIKNIYDNL